MYLESDLFKKYFKKRDKELQQKEIVQKVILEIIGIEISLDRIQIKNQQLTFLISPIQKNELLLHKEDISKKLEEQNIHFKILT